MTITHEYATKNGCSIHPATLEKLNKGYKSAKTLLNFSATDTEKEEEKKTDISVYRWQDINKLINSGLMQQVKKPPKGAKKTGIAYFRKRVFSEIYTDENGQLFAVVYIK